MSDTSSIVAPPKPTASAAFRHFEQAPVALWQDISRQGPILVVAPHPDDETLGCGGLIAELAAQGIEVAVAVLTDGARSHPNSRRYDAIRLRDLREIETENALRLLGIETPDAVFFREPDGFLQSGGDHGRLLVEKLSAIVEHGHIRSVFVTWGADPHPDHLAAYNIVMTLARSRPELRVFAYPIWALTLPSEAELSLPYGPALRLEIRSQRERKRRALACYASQVTRMIDDDPGGFLLTEEHIALFCSDFEVFIDIGAAMGRPAIRASSVPTEHFDALYGDLEDPWGYLDHPYERQRFAETLRALPRPRYSKACEIGCSIGVLTERLAGRCDSIIGVDCSDLALVSARQRLAGTSNSTVMKMRVPDELPDGMFDLIVFSEVLYFFSGCDLARLTDWSKRHLLSGGDCILVNYLGDTESPLTGNEAADAFIAHAAPNLHLMSTKPLDGFRIDVLTRRNDEASDR